MNKALIPYEYLCPDCGAPVSFVKWGLSRYLIWCSACHWCAMSDDLYNFIPDLVDYA